jgi:5-methyltetrahydrofolate--homocysteine methyltransferase
MFQQENLKEEDFRGRHYRHHSVPLKGMNDLLSITRPELVKSVHHRYLEAGADVITTNSFNANFLSLQPYGLEQAVYEVNYQAALVARESVARYNSRHASRSCFVAGSMGPTDKMSSLSPDISDPGYRSIDFDQLAGAYHQQARGLLDGGVDAFLIETVFDTLNAKAALYAVNQVMREARKNLPVMVSLTISGDSGRTLSGQTVEAFYNALQPFAPFSIGLNCSFGPARLLPYLERLSEKSTLPVSAHPNAGLPNELGHYDTSAAQMASDMDQYFRRSLVNMVGGCCGSRPEHIQAIAGKAAHYAPRPLEPHVRSTKVSGLQSLSVKNTTRLIRIGERTNASGSAEMMRLIREERYEEALGIGREQIEAGADMLNISVDEAMIDSDRVLPAFLRRVAAEPDVAMVPLMLDSSRFTAIVKGLKELQGKSMVNSISLKDGEEAFKQQAQTIHRLGAAVVVMAFDEQGQGDTFERKTQICQRAYRILTRELKFPPEDIVFDPNVLAVGTGVVEHNHYALDFLNAIRWIKEHLPHARVNAGISNVSFAFRGNRRLREAINSVFLHHCEQAELDFAIINPAGIFPYKQIPGKLRRQIDDLLFNRRGDATGRLIEAAGGYDKKARAYQSPGRWREQAPEKRLGYALKNGITRYLEQDLLEIKEQYPSALKVIEGPLMEGMKEVGERFGKGRMFLPQVIKSARVMQEAVTTLMPFIQDQTRSDELIRGKILLATVQGDVHDIGKNILAMVLRSNHFEVVDLGVMVERETILQMVREQRPDILALSGLITPSLDQMAHVIRGLEDQGFQLPVMVGGATTSALHTAVKLAPQYSGPVVHVNDVTKSVEVAGKLAGKQVHAYAGEVRQRQQEMRQNYLRRKKARKFVSLKDARKKRFHYNYEEESVEVIPRLLGTKVFNDFDLNLLRNYIDWSPFFHGWGLKGIFPQILDKGKVGREATRLFDEAQQMLERIIKDKLLKPKGIIGIFPANSEGDDILIYHDERRKKVKKRIPMLRQQQLRGQDGFTLSLSDFIAPADSGIRDYLGGFAVTSGFETEKHVKHFKREGDSYNSIMVRLIADRLVEAFAEVLHEWVRKKYWAYEPDEKLSKEELIKERYKGIRPAPGYPACPDHTLKGHLFELLRVEQRIGISLTESFAMNPASSVAGFYMAHDLSKYFGIGKIGQDQLEDYARRASIDPEEAEKWLSPVLEHNKK